MIFLLIDSEKSLIIPKKDVKQEVLPKIEIKKILVIQKMRFGENSLVLQKNLLMNLEM